MFLAAPPLPAQEDSHRRVPEGNNQSIRAKVAGQGGCPSAEDSLSFQINGEEGKAAELVQRGWGWAHPVSLLRLFLCIQ